MKRSIEQQRIGGPNSLRTLRERGFFASGSHPDQTTWKGVEVKPVIVTARVGTSDQETFTVFKPRSGPANKPSR